MLIYVIIKHMAGRSTLGDLLSNDDRKNGQTISKRWLKLIVLSRCALEYQFIESFGFQN